ncbi:cupin domain-containing protein [Azohydromonas australica]|uniref:cupin domain-containing protein n=1 Tax=Azohydromonas australica TaxID=364039 RepID=UPI00040B3951|nr:cupin domain-containing protein [Azohydromonas australica]
MNLPAAANLFVSMPGPSAQEQFLTLLKRGGVRIERIVSQGHTAPAEGWFDQDEDEWVLVLEGAGRLLFEDGCELELRRGDHVDIPAHVRHKVTWTDPDRPTVWLAVFYA